MRAKIHRGAREIGGSCVELEAAGRRLVLDLGRPLVSGAGERVPLPDIPGLAEPDPSLLGAVISHGHPDHCGLAPLLDDRVPLFMGEVAHRVLDAAAFFTGTERLPRLGGFLREREPIELGPFRLTPYLADHSAFDAYSLLVEADRRRLFYSGDLRGHGRKVGAFSRLLREVPSDVNVLLLEGTHVRSVTRAPPSEVLTEQQLELECANTFRATPGMVLACYSPQNIDRLVTLYKATIRAERDFVMDLYTATVARATGKASVPQAGWDRVRVFLPESQKRRVVRNRAFERTDAVKTRRIYPEELAARAQDLVVTFRESMAGDLERANCLDGAQLAWSLWPGYLDEPDERIRRFCKRHAIPLHLLHSSGHASVEDLQRLADALAAGRVVPIHTAAPARFGEYFACVELHADGEWWEC